MKNKISVCGVYCHTDCYAYGNDCPGCNKLKGRVSWVKYIGKSVCPIYECVRAKGIANCGECPELPCPIIMIETRNPGRTDEEYKADIDSRIQNLKNLQ